MPRIRVIITILLNNSKSTYVTKLYKYISKIITY